MTGSIFVDTNVLVYAHDVDAGAKHVRARAIVRELWDAGNAVVSTQVLQELHRNVTRKIPTRVPLQAARDLVRAYATWRLERIDLPHILRASEIEERFQLSFWDALIMAAAASAGADRILSEDLSHGQRIDGVTVENPFA